MASQPIHQLERFIRQQAMDSFNVAFYRHAEARMRERHITKVMVLEARVWDGW